MKFKTGRENYNITTWARLQYIEKIESLLTTQRGLRTREVNTSGCVQTDATTPNIVATTMLGVVACVLAVVCKRMQQLPTMLVPAVHRGKVTTHKSLQTVRNERARPRTCWKSCANRSNIVAPRFGDHGTKEMLGVVG